MRRAPGQNSYTSRDKFEELQADQPADGMWRPIGGRVRRMMVWARLSQKRIMQNLTVALMNEFRQRGSDRRPYDESFWLKTRSLDLACIPNVMVRSGATPMDAVSIVDSVVLMEVGPKRSAQRERFEKWALYPLLPSLQHYVLIGRDHNAVDLFSRAKKTFNLRPRLTSSSDTPRVPAFDFEMAGAEAYRDVIPAAS